MSATQQRSSAALVWHSHDQVTLKMSRPALMELTWAEYFPLTGTLKAAITNDLVRRDLKVAVRTDPVVRAAFYKAHPDLAELAESLDAVDVILPFDNDEAATFSIGDDWVELRADMAARLSVDCEERREMGGHYGVGEWRRIPGDPENKTEYVTELSSGFNHSDNGARRLFEFRMPGERELVTASR